MKGHIQVRDLISVNFVAQRLVRDQICNHIKEQPIMMTKDINVRIAEKVLKEEDCWTTT